MRYSQNKFLFFIYQLSGIIYSGKGMNLLNCYIASTDEEIIEYEKCLFRAFVIRGKNYNFWIKSKYLKSGKNRLKPYISYNDLLIFIIKNDDKIMATRVFNMNMNNTQIERIGFKVNLDKRNTCEAIHMFSLEENSIQSLVLIKMMNRFIKNYLININIKKIYGICFRKHLKMYKVLGMKIIGTRTNIFYKSFLLVQDFNV
jgi:hypothetical protein